MLHLKRRNRSKSLKLYKSLMLKNKMHFKNEKPAKGIFFNSIHTFFKQGVNALGGMRISLSASWHQLRPRGKASLSAGVAILLILAIVLPIVLSNPQTVQAAAIATPSPTPSLPVVPTCTPSLTLSDATIPIGREEAYTGDTHYTPPTAPPESEQAQYVKLSPGDQNEAVKRLQERLMELNYFDNDEVTDFYGPVTEYSVQLFQRQYGLMVDGIAGPETQALLFNEDAHPYTVYPGNKGSDIEGLQRRLKEMNYFNDEITGFYGESTEAAVRSFQKLNNLSIDGIVGTNTRDLIFSPNAKEYSTQTPKPTNKPQPTKNPADASKVSKMIAFAKEQQGKRYVRGAEGAKTFDCSGFAYYVLNHMGVKIGRYNAAGFSQMSSWTKITSISKLKAGDLVFFRSPRSSRVSHMAIYIGSGKIIHASSSHGKVLVADLSNYFKQNFVCGRRVF